MWYSRALANVDYKVHMKHASTWVSYRALALDDADLLYLARRDQTDKDQDNLSAGALLPGLRDAVTRIIILLHTHGQCVFAWNEINMSRR